MIYFLVIRILYRISLAQDYGSNLLLEYDGYYWRKLKLYIRIFFESVVRLIFDSLYLGIFDSSYSFFVFMV